MASIPGSGGACPVKVFTRWLRLRAWFKDNKGRDGCTSGNRASQEGSGNPNAPFVGLARAKFGFGLAAAGVAAAMKKVTSGRLASPGKGGAKLHVTSGMSHEATEELGWRSPEVVKKPRGGSKRYRKSRGVEEGQ